MPLPINEFADAFSGWMKEYAEKQQVSCGTERLYAASSTAPGNYGGDMPHQPEPAAGIQSALAEHNKQMDKPLRIVDDMVKEKE